MNKKSLLSAIAAMLIHIGFSYGTTFYVDPIHGDMANDGSAERPWKTLQEVFDDNLIETQSYSPLPINDSSVLKPKNPGAPIKAGDTILLRSGYHGSVWYRGAYNNDYITIAAEPGHTPILKSIMLSATKKWILRGLTVSPEHAPDYSKSTLIHIESHGWHGPSDDVIIENCQLYSVRNTSLWTADDWNNLACSGIQASATNMIVRDNTLTNVNFGIVLSKDNSIAERNKIVNIAGDGIVGGADNLTIQYNIIKNFYKVNENHDDGIQFHRGTNPNRVPMRNAVIRGNLIVSHDPDETNPLLGSPQGIGCFDQGMYIGWRVENNVVLVQHWHGISVYGGEDSVIINNLAIDPTGKFPTWISLGNGGRNTVIRNNISSIINGGGEQITVDHNILLRNMPLDGHFKDFKSHDFRLSDNSPAIDAGSPEFAPAVDIAGTPRPRGYGIDIGPYELGAADTEPDSGSSLDLPLSQIDGGFVTFNRFKNMFHPTKGERLQIGFRVLSPAKVSISVYNRTGEKMIQLKDGDFPEGPYTVQWDGRTDVGDMVASGIYHLYMTAGEQTVKKKVAVIK